MPPDSREDRFTRFLRKLYQALRILTGWIEEELELKPRFLTCPHCGGIVEKSR